MEEARRAERRCRLHHHQTPIARVALALGSNIDPEANLAAAAALLRATWPGITFSSVWKSAAMEVQDQADFLNAAAVFESNESPAEILKKLQDIEQSLKKSVPYRFGPRTIDLDLLLVDYKVSKNDPLLPHPKMHERRFVLEPLTELIDPATQHPALRWSLRELLEKVKEQECERTEIRL